MAYNNAAPRPAFRQPSAAAARPAAPTTGERIPPIFSTGLFRPTKEGVKSLGSVQVKEDLHIPAGSYINLYPVDKEGENLPAFKLSITVGKKKA